jgi:hypothetical protein
MFIILFLLSREFPKNLSLDCRVSSYSQYYSLIEERGLDSLYPSWTSGLGMGLGVGVKWKKLIAKLEYNGTGKDNPMFTNVYEDSLVHITDFGLFRGLAGLYLSNSRVAFCMLAGYGTTWEHIALKTGLMLDSHTDEKILREEKYSRSGFSYGVSTNIKLFDVSRKNSPWKPLLVLDEGCARGKAHSDWERSNRPKILAGEGTFPLYLNMEYFAFRGEMEKFSVGFIAKEPYFVDFLIGTSLYLKEGKFKWWEVFYIGFGKCF